MAKIKVSQPTYNEIVDAFEKAGYKLGENVSTITIDKNDQLERPTDYRNVTIRRDVADIATKVYKEDANGFISFAKELYEYIVTGKLDTPPNPSNPNFDTSKEWK